MCNSLGSKPGTSSGSPHRSVPENGVAQQSLKIDVLQTTRLKGECLLDTFFTERKY